MSEQQKIIEELEKIKELLTPKPTTPVSTSKGIWNEFKDFLKTYKILGFTIAFIMGIYLGNLAQSLVKDLLLPLIGLAIPELQDLASYSVVEGQQTFGYGNFLVALITLLIVALLIFLAVKVTKKWGIE
jgi:large conductance mechanosensitive channel